MFFNPNIHALAEYMRRREGASLAAERLGVPLIFADALSEEEQTWDDPWLRDAAERFPLPPGEESPPGERLALPPATNPVRWLRAVSGREEERCLFCWRVRLQKTAELALAWGFDAFSSSLLFSRHQNHEAIRRLGEDAAESCGLVFAYDDYRPTWKEGVRLSKEWGVYRQQYCGCVFSEYERYSREFAGLRERAALENASAPVLPSSNRS